MVCYREFNNILLRILTYILRKKDVYFLFKYYTILKNVENVESNMYTVKDKKGRVNIKVFLFDNWKKRTQINSLV